MYIHTNISMYVFIYKHAYTYKRTYVFTHTYTTMHTSIHSLTYLNIEQCNNGKKGKTYEKKEQTKKKTNCESEKDDDVDVG